MSVKVTRNEWLRRFQQGTRTVDDDGDGVLRRRDDDDDDDAVDNVDADACGGRRVRIGRRRRGGTMCHVSITASSIIVYVCGLLFSLHERAI